MELQKSSDKTDGFVARNPLQFLVGMTCVFLLFFFLFNLMQRQEKMVFKSLVILKSMSSFPVLEK